VCSTLAPPRAAHGNATPAKEDVRKWFVDRIDRRCYLPPENLFYTPPRQGVIIVLNKANPKERQKTLPVQRHAATFVRADPK